MKNQEKFTEFKLTKCGEIISDKLNDFELSLNNFYFKNNKSYNNSFLVKGFEINDQNLVVSSLLSEYEEMLEELIFNI
ncbi:MAG: hypothetical protein ACFFEY_02660 [Candidatus Thorarchaeota archaeon]